MLGSCLKRKSEGNNTVGDEALNFIAYGGTSIGFETLELTGNKATGLKNIPSGAKAAVISLEVDQNASLLTYDNGLLKPFVRYIQDNATDPTIEKGMPLAHFGTIEIFEENLRNVTFINIDPTLTNVLQVSYFN